MSIDELVDNHSLSYSNLVIYHFSTKSVKYSEYKEEMKTFMTQSTCAELLLYFLFALFWVVSVPCVLGCMLWALKRVYDDIFAYDKQLTDQIRTATNETIKRLTESVKNL